MRVGIVKNGVIVNIAKGTLSIPNSIELTNPAWQIGWADDGNGGYQAPPPLLGVMKVYTRDKFLLAMPTAVQIEMQMIMDGAIQIGADATAIATNRATLKVVDRSFSSNPIIESANAETQAMYDVLEAIVPSFDAAVRALLETGE